MEHEGPLPSGKRSPTGPAPPDPKWEPGLAGNPQPRKLLGGGSRGEETSPGPTPFTFLLLPARDSSCETLGSYVPFAHYAS